MFMEIRDKHEGMRNLIKILYLSKNRFWRAVAKLLNRPRRKRFEVNLYKLEKHVKPNEKVIVPGIVLGQGTLKKPLTIAAVRFSKSAREKIIKANGRCLSIREMFEKNRDGKNIRIIG